MARPQKIRRITERPAVSGFKPYGTTNKSKQEFVFLLCEEYEAIRLYDYEKCEQAEAAAFMQVSRPTFTRIYGSAKEKIAKAFVEGRQIVVEGGKIDIESDKEWYTCLRCNSRFNIPDDMPQECPLCNNREIQKHSDNKNL